MTIIGAGEDATGRQAEERDTGVIFKNCTPFINCKSKMNNTEKDNAKDIDIIMPMYKLVEYSDSYSKTSRSLLQHYTDEPNNNLTDSKSFKSKIKISGNTPADSNTKDVDIVAPLKYLNNIWKTLETPLIVKSTSFCVITNSTGAETCAIRYTKRYVPSSNFINSRSRKTASTSKICL